VGVFGWGVVAPKSANIKAFEENLLGSESWLSPFNGFGPDNFLVGEPEFCFEDYQPWIGQRFAPRQYQNLKEKIDLPALFAIGAFIQALEQNPGLEQELKLLGERCHVYVGTGLGSLGTMYDTSVALYEAQARWDRFWARPENNRARREYVAPGDGGVPPDPRAASYDDLDGVDERAAAERSWSRYWAARSPELGEYLAELAEIDGGGIEGGIAAGKLNSIRDKEKRRARLREKWRAPEPPWKVSANLIWNIHNMPAAQISILGGITGMAFAPVAACSTFGVALQLAMRAIQCGDAKAVIMGATDPPPHPLAVGAFYSARVIAADGRVSTPLSQLKGTHVAGGSVIWIVGDLEYMRAKGFQPLGMEPVAVGVTSDAHHIITPSLSGPRAAVLRAVAEASATADGVGTWDLHATATPGDYAEMETVRSLLPRDVLVTARKGTFGHGMSAGGGWELTAQYLGYQRGKLFPTPLAEAEMHPAIRELHDHVVFDQACAFPDGLAGKLSMGIGGINACVISRPLERGLP
jgi:3-oxoacyl-(acyl-carrier-protein) synthase